MRLQRIGDLNSKLDQFIQLYGLSRNAMFQRLTFLRTMNLV